LNGTQFAGRVRGIAALDRTMTLASRVQAPRSVGLDAVRAVAILMVLVGHCGAFFCWWYGIDFPWQVAVGGFYGVELFFVLSGLLIGRLLIDILDCGPTPRAWLVFMTRRWERTLPLYFLWVFVLAVLWPPQASGADSGTLWRILPWYLTMTQNFAWARVDEWFGVSWSLAVEEWFYLLFSALLFAAAALAGRRAALFGAVALFLVVPAVLRWRLAPEVDWDRVTSIAVIYRLDAIAFGVIVAWMSVRGARLLRHWRLLLVLGLLIIAALWHAEMDRLPQQVRQTFIFDAAGLGFALCLPAAMAAQFRGLRWALPGIQALSRQSYAIYIMHMSLLEFVNHFRSTMQIPTTLCVAIVIAAIFGLSWASYRFIEAPILAFRPRQNAPALGGAAPQAAV
jgi:peptidoglycan/LPS O-acetylase OafA/YrhL